MIRVKYNKDGDVLTSKKTILCGRSNVQAVLNTAFLSFSLTDVDSGDVLAVGTAKTVPALKIATKAELAKLGAVFGDEIRRHTIEEGLDRTELNGIAC